MQPVPARGPADRARVDGLAFLLLPSVQATGVARARPVHLGANIGDRRP